MRNGTCMRNARDRSYKIRLISVQTDSLGHIYAVTWKALRGLRGVASRVNMMSRLGVGEQAEVEATHRPSSASLRADVNISAHTHALAVARLSVFGRGVSTEVDHRVVQPSRAADVGDGTKPLLRHVLFFST